MSYRPLTSLLAPAPLALAGLILAAGNASAQACIGLPTRDGDIVLMGNYAITEDYHAIGGEFTADATGPLTFGFGYSRDTGMDELIGGGEQHVTTFHGRAAYELYVVDPSICGVAGFQYQDSNVERLGIPVGFGFGKTLNGPRASATIYAVPQYVWLQEKPGGALPDETSNEFMAEAGVTLGLRHLLLGGALLVSTFEDDQPRFLIRAGFLF